MDVFLHPVMLIVGIPFGILYLITPFGILSALPAFALFVGAGIAKKKNNMKRVAILGLTAVLGQWLLFLSWMASYHLISAQESTRQWGEHVSYAAAGFPFSGLQVPPSPLGNGMVPMEMWGSVAMNHLFWFAVAFVIAFLIIPRHKKIVGKKFLPVCAVITALALFYNFALFMLWYD